MRIWFTRASHSQLCSDADCGKEIAKGDFALKSHHKEDGSRHTTRYWHAECLMRVSKRVLEVEQPPTLGRKPMELTEEQRTARVKLLQHYAANRQRMARYEERLPDKVLELRIYRLVILQHVLRAKIMAYGGPPKSWEASEFKVSLPAAIMATAQYMPADEYMPASSPAA